MIEKLLNAIFPPKCPFCGNIISAGIPLCLKCAHSIPFIYGNICSICGRPLDEYSHTVCTSCRNTKMYFKHTFVPLEYRDTAKDAILKLKSHHPYYAKAFAYLIADNILSSPYYTDFGCITFVPQNPRSRRKNGYNHAELIAKELSRLLHIPCIPTLRKTNDGSPQHTLNAAARRENVKKCFFKTNVQANGTVVLIDDIYTTGSTANYCSKLLLEMGFDSVYVAVATIRCEEY